MQKQPKAAAPAPAQTVAQATTQQVAATTVAVPATYYGLPAANLTKSQLAFATAKAPVALAPKVAGAVLQLGKVAYKVRSGNNAAWFAQCQAALAAGGGKAPASAMVAAGACPKFVGYAVARGWLAPVTA